MLIHNVYSDLLSSCSYFLNNFVLTDYHIKIQNFQYNIGNSSYQLNYETQYELPSAIISLQSPIPFINRPYTFHRNILNNKNKISVLYDRTKDIELFVQEEMYTVPVLININCESQLQALEIQHRIMNYMPLNKYLQAYTYTSFFEIDPNLLSKYLIDVSKDKVDNLFYKQNKYTDSFDYCFSVEYEPLIRLNSCDIGIDSSTSSSFQVSCSFEFLTHIPVYMIAPNVNWSNLVSHNHLQYNNIPVPAREDHDYILVELNNTISNASHKELWYLNNGLIQGEYKAINKRFDAVTLFKNRKYESIIHIQEGLDRTINHDKSFIDGEKINGTLRQVKFIDSRTITAFFVGFISGESIQDFLNFEVTELDFIRVAGDFITNPNPPLELLSYKLMPNKINILNSIKNINRSAVKINPHKTYITKYIDINNNEVILNSPVFINEFTNEFTIPDIGVTGYLDLDLFNLNIYNTDHPILYLYFNLSFDFVKGIPTSIERISYNFNTTDQIITNNNPHQTISEFSEFNTALISDITYNEEDTQISFSIRELNIKSQDLQNINFRFIPTKNNSFTILDYNYLKLDMVQSDSSKLVFQLVNPGVYWKFFSKANTLEPIYFCFTFEENSNG
jgi:hypothetical protein